MHGRAATTPSALGSVLLLLSLLISCCEANAQAGSLDPVLMNAIVPRAESRKRFRTTDGQDEQRGRLVQTL